ncbi:MAG: hypothetical protein U5L96_18465 [Owenweeksia sp.]|nr:hypothetical protein [Owenweeksia sp.]
MVGVLKLFSAAPILPNLRKPVQITPGVIKLVIPMQGIKGSIYKMVLSVINKGVLMTEYGLIAGGKFRAQLPYHEQWRAINDECEKSLLK